MSSIFTPCELGVLRINNDCAKGSNVVISVADYAIELPITGFTLDLGTNHQFLHTLDEFIYLYAFGDRIGELVLTGVAFTGNVTDESCNDISKNLGPSNLLTHYMENRISHKDGPKSTLINIDATPVGRGAGSSKGPDILIGFLTGMRMDMPNPSLPIVQWALRYQVVINDRPLALP